MEKPLLFLDFKGISKLIQKENIFFNVSFYKKFPETLQINMSLNAQFFLYLNNKGQVFKILKNAKLLKITPQKKYSEPVLMGKIPENSLQKQKFLNFIFQLLEFRVLVKKISTIRYISEKEVHLFLEKPYLKIKINWFDIASGGKTNLKKLIIKIDKVLIYLSKHSYKLRTMDARFLNKIFVSY